MRNRTPTSFGPATGQFEQRQMKMTTGNNNQNYGPHDGQGNWNQPPSAPSGSNAGYQQGGYDQGQYGHAPYGQPQYDQQGYGGQPPYGQPPQGGGGSKTALIIGGIVVALLAIGAAVYFFFFAGDDKTDADEDQTTIEETTEGGDTTTDSEENTTPEDDIFTTDPEDDITTDGGLTDDETNGEETYGDPNGDPAQFRQGMEDILAASGLTEETAAQAGITSDQWDSYLNCITDESLQRLAPDAIESISNGVDVYDEHSVNEISDIAIQCGADAGIG